MFGGISPVIQFFLFCLQQGMIELFIRLVNFRDADTQSLSQVSVQNAGLYSFPPQVSNEHSLMLFYFCFDFTYSGCGSDA